MSISSGFRCSDDQISLLPEDKRHDITISTTLQPLMYWMYAECSDARFFTIISHNTLIVWKNVSR